MSDISVQVRPRRGRPTFPTHNEAVDAMQSLVTAALAGRVRARVLEAGAGKRTRFQVPADAYVVGVDTDPAAMLHNTRLDERVVADLTEYAPGTDFCLVTCWYVLEHVDDPAGLLARLAGWTAPGGLLVLAVPHLHSPKSVLTKFTPHRFHVWFRRRVLGYPRAGTPGYGPYPTTLRPAIAPAALRARLATHGLVPVLEGFFEDAKQVAVRRRLRLTGAAWRLLCLAVRVGSLGLLDAERSEYVVVLRRD